MNHPDRQALIDYRFDLLDDACRTEVQAHLDVCDACRQHLADLEARFASLELLRGDPEVSPALLAAATAHGASPAAAAADRRSRMADRFSWLAVAAGLALVIGLFWLTRSERGAGLTAETWPEKPFLPGSNIELNVLPRRDRVQVTIYNAADLTLVRERRDLTMKRGWNWLQYMWANTLIDPTSLELIPADPAMGIDVRSLVFPPRLKDVGRWLIFSPISGQAPCDVVCFTSGLSWRATYQATLSPDETAMRLQGYVRVANRSGETYDNAQVRLVVGETRLTEQIAMLAQRPHAYGAPGEMAPGGAAGGPGNEWEDAIFIDGHVKSAREENAFRTRAREVLKEGLSEYYLYTIEGTDTLADGWDRRLPSFDTAEIPVENLYKSDPDRWGDQTIRFLYFRNDEAHRLGQTPLPEGQLQLFRALPETAGSLAYEGAAPLKYIPVGDKAELELGPAETVTVTAVRMAFRTENHHIDHDGNLDGWDEVATWELRLANRRPLAVRLEITRPTGTPSWRIEADDGGYTRHDATHLRWTPVLEPHTPRTIVYTLRTHHGVNQE